VTAWLNAPFRLQFRVNDGLTIRFAESEAHPDHALLLSPWPESALAFEPTWARLAEHTHLVAIDLPGFGHSQGSESLLSPQSMAEFIIRAADTFGLRQPHVVAPGAATHAALFAAAAHPGRLRSLVVGNAPIADEFPLTGHLRDLTNSSDIGELRDADPARIVTSALGQLKQYVLPEAVRADYLASYQGNRLVGSLRYLHACLAQLPALRELLLQIQTPVQVIAGRGDTAVPPANAEFLHQFLPRSALDLLDTSQFAWEDAASEYAALVTRWWAAVVQ
jgi:pimeloyl-ACP methyl ester carboxylesterase